MSAQDKDETEPLASLPLKDSEIIEVFEKLNLATAEDREKVLRLENLGDVEAFCGFQQEGPATLLRFSDSTQELATKS
ncbi:MAG: hypothetical protein LAP21_09450 [Acidobacteriia bacterium]|nr:hypothetical protein [Terriglobia bacterium]